MGTGRRHGLLLALRRVSGRFMRSTGRSGFTACRVLPPPLSLLCVGVVVQVLCSQPSPGVCLPTTNPPHCQRGSLEGGPAAGCIQRTGRFDRATNAVSEVCWWRPAIGSSWSRGGGQATAAGAGESSSATATAAGAAHRAG